MTEAQYIDQLKSLWPEESRASREVLSLAAEAVRDFPRSATLWFLRGQPITMAPDDYIFYEELGRCHDGVRKDPEKAKEYYRKAARLRGEPLD